MATWFLSGKLFGVATLIVFGEKRCRKNLPLGNPVVSKTAKSWLRNIGICVALIAVLIFVGARDMQSLAPPPNATTLTTFADLMPEPTRLAQIEDAGETKIVWVGDTAMWAFPSGPSCYIFDSNGKLIEWDASTGDGEPTTRYLQPAWNSEPLTIDQALALVPRA